MSDRIQLHKDSEAIQEHHGIPNKPFRQGEKGWWQRFLEALIPGLKTKWVQAEHLLEARLRQEMGKALQEEGKGRQEIAKAQQLEDQARQIGDLAAQREAEMLEEAEYTIISDDNELQRELEEIKEELRMLKLKYGTLVEFTTDQDDNVISRALSKLHPREAEMLRLHLGLGRDSKLSYTEIGQRFGFSAEEARKIVSRRLSDLGYLWDE